MSNEFKRFKYTKNDIKFKILSSGISKTNISRFIAKIPKKYFKGINKLVFLKISDHEMYTLISNHHHSGETNFNRNYHGTLYEDDDGSMNIAIYVTDDFYKELNKNKVWIDIIRGIILHELGHHLIHLHGLDNTFNEVNNELLVDRFMERNSDIRVLMLVSPKKIREFDKIWDKIS